VVASVANGVLRVVIIVVAGFSIWQFSDGFLLAWETLAEPTEARWFNVRTTEKRFCLNFICLRARYRAFGGAFRSAR
jgi:hypothetical protein